MDRDRPAKTLWSVNNNCRKKRQKQWTDKWQSREGKQASPKISSVKDWGQTMAQGAAETQPVNKSQSVVVEQMVAGQSAKDFGYVRGGAF